MSDQQRVEKPENTPIEKAASKNKVNPVLLLFLIFPILGIVAALVTGGQNNGAGPFVPPPVAFTPMTRVGSAAPDFTLATPDGASIQLSSLRGRWVYLNFWATWCLPCRQEMPTFQRFLNGAYGDFNDQVMILGVNQLETSDQVNAYLRKLNLRVPVVLDSEAKATNLYGVVQLPVTFIIDPQGVVRYEHIGEITAKELQAYLLDAFGTVGYLF